MINEPWIIGSLWDCLSLEQENTGCLKLWIRVSELNMTSADKPVPGREAGRQEVIWQDCHGLWGQQAQCWSRCCPGLPPLKPNMLSFGLVEKSLGLSTGHIFPLSLHLMLHLSTSGLLLVFCWCTTEWKVCHFCPMDEPQQYYERWKSTVWFHLSVKSKLNI